MVLVFYDKIGVFLFQKCGIRIRIRIVDIRKVIVIFGIDVCMVFIGMYLFIGCDIVSVFVGKGKINVLKLLIICRNIQYMFFKLGEEWNFFLEFMNELEVFICFFYVVKGVLVKVNDFRYNLFCIKKGEIESY